jgi:hypothetical protein
MPILAAHLTLQAVIVVVASLPTLASVQHVVAPALEWRAPSTAVPPTKRRTATARTTTATLGKVHRGA